MKVSELIEWLKTQDQEATVEVLCREPGRHGYGGDGFSKAEFNPETHAEYTDFRGNKWVKDGDAHKDRRFLFLGDA